MFTMPSISLLYVIFFFLMFCGDFNLISVEICVFLSAKL